MSNIVTDGTQIYFSNEVLLSEVNEEIQSQENEKAFFAKALIKETDVDVRAQTQANIDRCDVFLKALSEKKASLS